MLFVAKLFSKAQFTYVYLKSKHAKFATLLDNTASDDNHKYKNRNVMTGESYLLHISNNHHSPRPLGLPIHVRTTDPHRRNNVRIVQNRNSVAILADLSFLRKNMFRRTVNGGKKFDGVNDILDK